MNAVAFREYPVSLGERVRAAIEAVLPWYDPALEAKRDRRSRRIYRFSIAARLTAERELTAEDKRLIATMQGTVKALRHGR